MNRYKKYKMRWNILEQYLRSEQNYYSKKRSYVDYEIIRKDVLRELLYFALTLDRFSNENLKNYIKRYKDRNGKI